MAEILKKHQQAMTIDEQIANLKAIGLQIDDEDYARRILGKKGIPQIDMLFY